MKNVDKRGFIFKRKQTIKNYNAFSYHYSMECCPDKDKFKHYSLCLNFFNKTLCWHTGAHDANGSDIFMDKLITMRLAIEEWLNLVEQLNKGDLPEETVIKKRFELNPENSLGTGSVTIYINNLKNVFDDSEKYETSFIDLNTCNGGFRMFGCAKEEVALVRNINRVINKAIPDFKNALI